MRTFSDIFKKSFLQETGNLSTAGFVMSMIAAFLCGMIIYMVYRYFYKGVIYNNNFNILIGIAVSALFPYMLVAFSMKSHTPSQTAQLSGMVQSGGYFLAAFGPTLFGFSFNFFGSWTVAALCLFICTIVMTAALFYTERFEKIQ